MTYIKRSLITAIATAMLVASPLATANPKVPMTDQQAAQAIKQADVSLEKAIRNAEKQVDGQAIAARLAMNAAKPAYMVEVVDKYGNVQVVRVTADNGRVTGTWPKAEYQGDSMTYREPE
ncbi:MAG: PepSY domain-containing protein [Burkholderiales bacterium]|jgi:hypothetical protein